MFFLYVISLFLSYFKGKELVTQGGIERISSTSLLLNCTQQPEIDQAEFQEPGS